MRVEATCPLSWVPGHQKYKMIRGTIPGPCNKCLSKGPWIITRTPYTVPVTYVQAAPPVVYKQVPTVVVPTIQPAVQPTVIVTATAPPRAPTLPQQIPGAGSGGAPLGDPPRWVKEVKAEWMPSKGCYENVVHYKKDPAAPATNQAAQQGGYNTIHGRDPGPLLPGWGAQPNPFPAPKKTGYNPAHGRDPGPPPPGRKSSVFTLSFILFSIYPVYPFMYQSLTESMWVRGFFRTSRDVSTDLCSGRRGSC
jgi:hypothetical protein